MTKGDVDASGQSETEDEGTVEIVLGDSTAFMRSLHETIVDDVFDVVGVASTGVEAVSLIDEHDPDVALLGMDLSIKNGLEAATEAKAANPELGVVLLCTSADVTPELLAEETVDEILTLPYQKSAMIRAISDLVGGEEPRAPG